MSDQETPGPMPQDAMRRSFHYRDLVAAGARFRTLNDGMVAADYRGADEAATARRLAIADLSPLPRTGFKGRNIAAWLAANGVVLGEQSNLAYPAGTLLAARLAPGEALILAGLDGAEEPVAASRSGLELRLRRRVAGAASRRVVLVRGDGRGVRGHVRQALRRRPQAEILRRARDRPDLGRAQQLHRHPVGLRWRARLPPVGRQRFGGLRLGMRVRCDAGVWRSSRRARRAA